RKRGSLGSRAVKGHYDYAEGQGGAYCLTKKRWATIPYLPVTSNCPALNRPFDQQLFCKSTEKAMKEADPNALLFSYSIFLGGGIYSCVTTVDPTVWLTSTTEPLLQETPSPNPVDPLYGYVDSPFTFGCGQGDFNGTVLRPQAMGAPL